MYFVCGPIWKMGNLFTRRNRIQPLTKIKQDEERKISSHRGFFNHRFRRIAPQIADDSDDISILSCRDVDDIAKIETMSREMEVAICFGRDFGPDFSKPRAELMLRKSELNAAEKIGTKEMETKLREEEARNFLVEGVRLNFTEPRAEVPADKRELTAPKKIETENIEKQSSEQDHESCFGKGVRLDFTVPRAQLLADKIELQATKKALPGINGEMEKYIFRRRVKRDKYGNTTSVCYDVSFNGPPDLSYLSRDKPQKIPTNLQKRVRKLPAIVNDAAAAK